MQRTRRVARTFHVGNLVRAQHDTPHLYGEFDAEVVDVLSDGTLKLRASDGTTVVLRVVDNHNDVAVVPRGEAFPLAEIDEWTNEVRDRAPSILDVTRAISCLACDAANL